VRAHDERFDTHIGEERDEDEPGAEDDLLSANDLLDAVVDDLDGAQERQVDLQGRLAISYRSSALVEWLRDAPCRR